jgi:MFS family permease
MGRSNKYSFEEGTGPEQPTSPRSDLQPELTIDPKPPKHRRLQSKLTVEIPPRTPFPVADPSPPKPDTPNGGRAKYQLDMKEISSDPKGEEQSAISTGRHQSTKQFPIGRLILKGANSENVDSITRDNFITNYFSLDFSILMGYFNGVNRMQLMVFAICGLSFFATSACYYSMGFFFSEPNYYCKGGNPCTELEYCADRENFTAEYAYGSMVQKFDFICGENIENRHHYQNIYFLAESYGTVLLMPLADVFGRKKTIIGANIFGLVGY